MIFLLIQFLNYIQNVTFSSFFRVRFVICRHQASESLAIAGEAEGDMRLKKAMTLLQQRKQLQRNLRALQQRTTARQLPPSLAAGMRKNWCSEFAGPENDGPPLLQ